MSRGPRRIWCWFVLDCCPCPNRPRSGLRDYPRHSCREANERRPLNVQRYALAWHSMRRRTMRWTWLILGVLAVLIGGVWTLQGLNILQGSGMSGNLTFAVIGPIVAVVGLILIAFGARRRVRSA